MPALPQLDPAFESQVPYLHAVHDQWTSMHPTVALRKFLSTQLDYLHKRAIETRNTPDVAAKYLAREHYLNGLLAVINSGEFMLPTAKPNPETY